MTPLRQLGIVNLLRYRRALGLLAFYNALFHLSVWLILDQGSDAHAIVADILRRPYITIGMLAFAAMVPLALTSTNYAIRARRRDAGAGFTSLSISRPQQRRCTSSWS